MNTYIKSAVTYISTLLLLSLLLPSLTWAQRFPPRRMSDSVNSEVSEINPVFSHGGDTLFFSRINHPENHYGAEDSQDIWMTVRDARGEWGKAQRLPNSVNIARYNALHGALNDGKTFLIAGAFDRKGTMWLRRGFSTIRAKGGDSLSRDSGFTVPERALVKWFSSMNEGDRSDATITPDGRMIFMSFSRRWASADNELFYSVRKVKKGDSLGFEYTRPKRIEGPIKNFKTAEAPYFSQADSCLYFSGIASADSAGRFQIYRMRPGDLQAEDIQWTDLTVLSDTVNAGDWNSYFRPESGGTYAIYSSTNETNGKSDLFQVMLVEERPWIKVTGKVVNARDSSMFPMEKGPSVLINGGPSDSLYMETETPEFFGLLPLDDKYVFTARAKNYTSDTVIVDVRGAQFYSEHVVNLALRSVPYVQVTGKMLNNLSLTPIAPKYKPELKIDGAKCDSIQYIMNKGYSVLLPFGRKYQFVLEANDHDPMPLELDLTAYQDFQEVNFDVFARPKNPNMVTLLGKFINTKTGKPLEPGHEGRMRVNRNESEMFRYDEKDASYQLMLPAGMVYECVPAVKNFYNRMRVVDLRKAKPRSKVKRNFFITPLEVGTSIDIENIFFETAKAKLKPKSFRSLNALVDFFREYPNVKVQIGGHTDNVGNKNYNRRLSAKRAKAVAEYLIGQGIPRDRFSIKGYGPDKPRASNKSKKGRAKNRRVDFTIEAL